MKKLKPYYWILSAINLAALAISIFLTYAHFKPEATDFCVLGEHWNCDVVNKSIYAEIFGVPVSLLGTITYLLLLIFSLRGLRKDQSKLVPYVTLFLGGATLFALYLTGIETFVLKTYCIFCVIQQILILIELGILLYLTFTLRHHEKTS